LWRVYVVRPENDGGRERSAGRRFEIERIPGSVEAVGAEREAGGRTKTGQGQLRRLVDAGRKERPGLRKLSPAMAVAVIGGINELVLLAVEEGRTQSLTELADTADDLLRAVLA